MAASQYFKNIDCLVDRDSLSQERENVKLIGNGWYWIDKERHAVGDNIDFLPISVHINNRGEEVVDAVRTFAKRGGGIGCRDFVPLNYLRENKIDSYYSGCLTTTLTRKFLGVGDNVERKGGYFG